MELRHLRYVLAIARERNFTRAASSLGIGQPPLSQQIKLLESELGVQLFRRLPRGTELTEAGQAFVPLAEVAVAAARQASEAARQAARGEVGGLTIGFTASASFNPLVTKIIGRFREVYPAIALTLVEQATSRLIAALADSRVDVAFLRPALDETDDLTICNLPGEPLWIAMPAGHALAARETLDLVELASEPFILYPRENGRALYDTIIASCRNAGFSPRIAQEAPQLTSTVNLVAAGVGIALVPESMCQLHAYGVTYTPISGAAPAAQIVLAYSRARSPSPAICNFISVADALKLSQ